MFATDVHSARLAVRRAELTEVQDDGPFQRITALGYADEVLRLGHRVQPFGLTSHPPTGAHGLALLVNGRPDQSVFLGIEHPDHRPRSIPAGTTALYNAHGDIIKLFEKRVEVVTETFVVRASVKIVLEAPEVHLGAEGGQLVHRKGDVDSAGDAAVGSATKVYAV